jgi:hypothetical protein
LWERVRERDHPPPPLPSRERSFLLDKLSAYNFEESSRLGGKAGIPILRLLVSPGDPDPPDGGTSWVAVEFNLPFSIFHFPSLLKLID